MSFLFRDCIVPWYPLRSSFCHYWVVVWPDVSVWVYRFLRWLRNYDIFCWLLDQSPVCSLFGYLSLSPCYVAVRSKYGVEICRTSTSTVEQNWADSLIRIFAWTESSGLLVLKRTGHTNRTCLSLGGRCRVSSDTDKSRSHLFTSIFFY